MSGIRVFGVFLVSSCFAANVASAADVPNSYADVVDRVPFEQVKQKMSADRERVDAAHRQLLEDRYDLADKPSATVKMSGGKPVQTGVRVKLPKGVTWESLGAMAPADVRKRDVYPA